MPPKKTTKNHQKIQQDLAEAFAKQGLNQDVPLNAAEDRNNESIAQSAPVQKYMTGFFGAAQLQVTCEICGQSCKRAGLKQHKRLAHGQPSDQPVFDCDVQSIQDDDCQSYAAQIPFVYTLMQAIVSALHCLIRVALDFYKYFVPVLGILYIARLTEIAGSSFNSSIDASFGPLLESNYVFKAGYDDLQKQKVAYTSHCISYVSTRLWNELTAATCKDHQCRAQLAQIKHEGLCLQLRASVDDSGVSTYETLSTTSGNLE